MTGGQYALGFLSLLAGRRRAWLSCTTWVDVEPWTMGANTQYTKR